MPFFFGWSDINEKMGLIISNAVVKSIMTLKKVNDFDLFDMRTKFMLEIQARKIF